MNGRVILVTAVGAARGSRAAAAALACAASREDGPGLLIDVEGMAPRPALVASAGARALEERLGRHLPELRVASRGQTCHMVAAGGSTTLEQIRAALPLARDSVTVVHVPQKLMRAALADDSLGLAGALLRADLSRDRAVTALAVGDLVAAGLVVRVLKRPMTWIAERRALFGLLPRSSADGLPTRQLAALLDVSSSDPLQCS